MGEFCHHGYSQEEKLNFFLCYCSLVSKRLHQVLDINATIAHHWLHQNGKEKEMANFTVQI